MSTVAAPISKVRLISGWVLSVLPSAMLGMFASMSIMKNPEAVKGAVDMGYPESAVQGIGIACLVSVILYLIPFTSAIGAILITGYLGGAVATHVHHGDPVFNVVFPAIFGAIIWTALILRNPRLEPILPGK